MRSRLQLPSKLHLLIYLSIMLVAGLLFSPSHFSTNMLSIFPQNSYTAQLEDASKLQSLNRLMIISKGDDKVSYARLEKIAVSLEELDGIDELFFKVNSIHSPTASYLREHYAERLDINSSRVEPLYVQERLQTLYNEMQSSFMFSGLNTSDPLDLFSDPMQQKRAQSKNGVVLFNGESYMLSATLKIRVSDVEGSQKLYDEVQRR